MSSTCVREHGFHVSHFLQGGGLLLLPLISRPPSLETFQPGAARPARSDTPLTRLTLVCVRSGGLSSPHCCPGHAHILEHWWWAIVSAVAWQHGTPSSGTTSLSVFLSVSDSNTIMEMTSPRTHNTYTTHTNTHSFHLAAENFHTNWRKQIVRFHARSSSHTHHYSQRRMMQSPDILHCASVCVCVCYTGSAPLKCFIIIQHMKRSQRQITRGGGQTHNANVPFLLLLLLTLRGRGRWVYRLLGTFSS